MGFRVKNAENFQFHAKQTPVTTDTKRKAFVIHTKIIVFLSANLTFRLVRMPVRCFTIITVIWGRREK